MVGVLHASTRAIHAIGEALAAARELTPNHAIKPIDRLLSTHGLDPAALTPSWVTFARGSRTDVVVALEWTDVDDEDQTTRVLNRVTRHGRATPRLWKTVPNAGLKTRRNG